MGVVLIATLAAAAVYALRGPLLAKPLARFVAERVSEAAGGRFSLERVEGNLLTEAVLVGLRTEAAPPGALRGLSFARAKVAYGLFDLLRGEGLGAVRSIDVVDGAIDVDFSESAPAAAPPPSDAPSALETFLATPPTIPRIAFDGRATATFAGGLALAGDATVVADARAARVEIRGLRRTSETPAAPNAAPDAPFPRTIVVEVERDGPGRLKLRTHEDEFGVVVAGSVERAPQDRSATADFALSLRGVAITGTMRGGALTLRTSDFDLAAVPAWVRSLSGVAPQWPAAGLLTVDLSIAPNADGGPTVAGTVSARGVRWREAAFERVAVAGTLAGDRARIDLLDVACGGAKIAAEAAELDVRTPWLLTRLRRIAIDVPDLAALAAALPAIEAPPAWTTRVLSATCAASSADGRRIEIASCALTTADGTLEADGRIALPDAPAEWRRTAFDLRFAARAWELDALLRDVVLQVPAPSGTLDLEGRAHGTIAAPRATLDLAGRDVRYAGRAFESVRLEGELTWPTARVRKLEIRIPAATLEASAVVDLDRGEIADGVFRLDATDLAAVNRFVDGAPPVRGNALIEGTFDLGAERRAALRGTLRADGVEIDGVAVGAVAADVAVEGTRLRLDAATVEGTHGRVVGRADLDLSDLARSSGSADFDLRIADVAALALERFVAGAPAIAGAATLSGRLTKSAASGAGAIGGALSLSAPALRIGERPPVEIELAAALDADVVTVSQARIVSVEGRLDASGSCAFAEGGGVVVRAATLTGESRGLRATLTAPTTVVWDGRNAAAQDFAFEICGGTVRGSAQVGERTAIALEGVGIDVSRLCAEVSGRIDVAVRAEGSLDAPTGTLRIAAAELRFRDFVGSVALDARQTAAGWSVDAFLAEGDGFRAAASGSVPWIADGRGVREVPGSDYALEAAATVRELGAWTNGPGLPATSFADATLKATIRGDEATAVVTGRDPSWSDDERELRIAGGARLAVRAGPDGLRVDLRLGEGGPAGVVASVETTERCDWRRPTEAIARLRAAALRGTAEATIPSLDDFRGALPGVARLDGALRARVVLAGSAVAPELTGDAAVENVVLRFEGDAPGFDGGARLRFAGRTLTLDALEGSLGYAPITVRGACVFDDAGRPVLDAVVSGERVSLSRSDALRLRADLALTVTGDLDRLAVAGEARITDAVYSQPIVAATAAAAAPTDGGFTLFKLRPPRLAALKFDVHAVAERTLFVDNNLLRCTLSGDVRLRGTGAAPRLEGRIAVDEGYVRLPLSKLRIERGELLFLRENGFAPLLKASARARVRDHDLAVRATGLIPDVELSLASLPPLPREDALLLLTAGLTSGDVAGDLGGGSAIERNGTFAGSLLLAGLVGGGEDDDDPFERLTLETSRGGAQGGRAIFDAEYRLGERYFLRAGRDQYEDYHLGAVWRIRFE